MLTRRIFKNCLVALMCLTFVAAGCGDDNDGNNGGGGQLTDAGNNSAQDGSSNNNNPDEDGGTEEDADSGEDDVDPNYDPCNDPDDPDAYCPCEEGMSYCDGECVNVNGSSSDHCGACGATCFDWSGSCEQGTCQCNDPDATWCDGFCISTEVDEVNCGECGNVCGGGDICFDSTCMSRGEKLAAKVNEARGASTMCSGSPMGPSAPLRYDPLLAAPAQEHAEDMDANDGEAQGDLGERVQQSEFGGQVTLMLTAPRSTADDLAAGLLGDYCSDALDPSATAIGVGVAGEVGELRWVVLIGNDG